MSTNPVSGGVPEQGPQVYPDLTSEQIEEIARILDEPQLKRLHGGILALSLRYVAAVQEAPRAIRQLRAALERPRPALPPETFADNRGLIGALQDIAYQARYDRSHAMLGGPTDPFEYYERISRTALAGAALPAEHAPPPSGKRNDLQCALADWFAEDKKSGWSLTKTPEAVAVDMVKHLTEEGMVKHLTEEGLDLVRGGASPPPPSAPEKP